MSKIVWAETGERFFETGIKNGVLYPQDSTGKYPKGVAWNGLTAVTESPSGADATDLYADDDKYLTLRAKEIFGGTIEAYQSPEEFDACDGTASLAPGVTIGQQARKAFGLCYRTAVGNDVDGTDHGYKLHLVYGATASPAQKAYSTINESPEAMTLSWEFTTTPVKVTGHKPTALLTIDSRNVDPGVMAKIEKVLYGDESKEASLPSPDEVLAIINAGA